MSSRFGRVQRYIFSVLACETKCWVITASVFLYCLMRHSSWLCFDVVFPIKSAVSLMCHLRHKVSVTGAKETTVVSKVLMSPSIHFDDWLWACGWEDRKTWMVLKEKMIFEYCAERRKERCKCPRLLPTIDLWRSCLQPESSVPIRHKCKYHPITQARYSWASSMLGLELSRSKKSMKHEKAIARHLWWGLHLRGKCHIQLCMLHGNAKVLSCLLPLFCI